MRHRSALFGGLEPLLDLLTYVEVVLGIFERRVIWQVIEQVTNFVLGSFQGTLQIPS